jgi:hypothetical protein
MFVFYFKTFLGQLFCDEPTHDNIPNDSPISILFGQDEDLTKHEMLRRFNNLLRQTQINWLRPLKELTSEWVIDLKEFKASYEILKDCSYLKGKLSFEAEYFQDIQVDEYTEEIKSIKSIIKFSIYSDDTKYLLDSTNPSKHNELTQPLERFYKDYSNPRSCGFLMMKFEDSRIQTEIVTTVRNCFNHHGFILLRADDKWYSDDLFTNIKTYMHACAFGVALFERINTNYFNPNVSLEIGYMMALNKPILYLKDRTLQSLHTDLIGKLYSEFDFQNSKDTLGLAIEKWLKMNEMI